MANRKNAPTYSATTNNNHNNKNLNKKKKNATNTTSTDTLHNHQTTCNNDTITKKANMNTTSNNFYHLSLFDESHCAEWGYNRCPINPWMPLIYPDEVVISSKSLFFHENQYHHAQYRVGHHHRSQQHATQHENGKSGTYMHHHDMYHHDHFYIEKHDEYKNHNYLFHSHEYDLRVCIPNLGTLNSQNNNNLWIQIDLVNLTTHSIDSENMKGNYCNALQLSKHGFLKCKLNFMMKSINSELSNVNYHSYLINVHLKLGMQTIMTFYSPPFKFIPYLNPNPPPSSFNLDSTN